MTWSGWRIATVAGAGAWLWCALAAPDLVGWATGGLVALAVARGAAAARHPGRSGGEMLARLRRHGDAVRGVGDASLVRPTHRFPDSGGSVLPAETLDGRGTEDVLDDEDTCGRP
jgi:hypothetical protein